MTRLAVCLLYLLLPCIALPQNSPTQREFAQIDSLLKTVYRDDTPGAAVAIVQNGKTRLKKSYGLLQIKNKATITPSTNFNIASLTKQFTALAVLQLAENHQLDLNDKISRFFPEISKKVSDSITIKQLLTHSSGIMDHYAYVNITNMRHAHNADVLEAIKNLDSTYFAPGTKFRYSNTGYCLLALIIQRVSGMPYDEYMSKNIFKPAGMKHTTIWNEHSVAARAATGYEWDSAQHVFVKSGPDEHIFFSTEGDGGIYTSVEDYVKWFTALQSGRVFSKAITDQARQIQFYIDKEKKLGYGCGWFIDAGEPSKKVYHSGSNGGFRTFSFTVPAEGFLIVIFSNRDDIDLEGLVLKINSIVRPGSKPFTRIEALTS